MLLDASDEQAFCLFFGLIFDATPLAGSKLEFDISNYPSMYLYDCFPFIITHYFPSSILLLHMRKMHLLPYHMYNTEVNR